MFFFLENLALSVCFNYQRLAWCINKKNLMNDFPVNPVTDGRTDKRGSIYSPQPPKWVASKMGLNHIFALSFLLQFLNMDVKIM